MRFPRLGLLLPVVLLLGCQPYTITYDYDRQATFAKLKTYDFYRPKSDSRPEDPQPGGSIMQRNVRLILSNELSARGYTREEKGDPDFLIACYPIFKEQKYNTYTTVGGGWGGYYGWGWGGGMGYGTTYVQQNTYLEGTIVMSVRDFKTNTLIWNGAASGALSGLEGATPDEIQERVTSAVTDLLKNFPPGWVPAKK